MSVSSMGGGASVDTGPCGGLAAAELKKKELDTEGKEEMDDPEAESVGLSGGDGAGEWNGLGRPWRVRIVSADVLIVASMAVTDKGDACD